MVIQYAGKADAAWEEDDEQVALAHDHSEEAADALATKEPPFQVCTLLSAVERSSARSEVSSLTQAQHQPPSLFAAPDLKACSGG